MSMQNTCNYSEILRESSVTCGRLIDAERNLDDKDRCMENAENGKARQLRYYIALSAPPTRSCADGSEGFMRPEPGFNPSWFHKFCEVDFSQRWHEEPEYRLECYNRMGDEVCKRFPGRNIGGIDDGEPVDLITGLYGSAHVPAMFGQQIKYFADKWPAPHGERLTDAQADALTPVDLANNEFFQGILRQVDRIKELTGSARGFLNWQGVLNTSFRLRGETIFMDLFDNPGRAHHIFDCVATTMIDGIKMLLEKQRAAGVEYRFATIANCVVNMMSADHYREYLLPYDLKIRGEFRDFGIHNCAWIVDPYMEAYATIPDLGYIDMGITSDLQKAKRLFPETRRNILYTSMDLANKSEQEIREDFEKIATELAPCDVGLPDIEIDVPDERVLLAMNLCEELSEKYGS